MHQSGQRWPDFLSGGRCQHAPGVHCGRLPEKDLLELWETASCRFYRERFHQRVRAHDAVIDSSSFEPSLIKLKETLNAAREAMPQTPDGCRVYEDRPSSCRAYPVARAISRNRETGGITEHFAIIREAHCKGFSEEGTRTVREWIDGQGLPVYFSMNDRLMVIISMKNQLRPGPLDLKDRLLFRTALYDLDAFRRQVIGNSLLEPLGIDAAEMDAIVSDDERLLEWGHRWVAFALFGEKGE